MKSALRNLLRDRKFTVFALLVLGLGIAANTTAFTLIRSVLLHELPFRDPDKLVWIWSTRTDRDKAFFSIPNFMDTRDSASTLREVAALALWPVNLTGSGDAERLQGVRLSANAFAMLGVRAAAGRLIEPTDGKPGNDLIVVLSHGLWRRRFGGSTGAIGGNVILNGVAYRVIGVLPRKFALPNTEADIISPFVFETDSRKTQRGANFLRAFARVKDGVSVEQVRLQLAAITDRLRTQFPDDNGKHSPPRVHLLAEELVGSYRASLWMLFAAISIVMAVACANLANLVSARASGRRMEMAVRAALGAGRLAPARSFFLESLALAVGGAAMGCALSWWMIQGITLLLPTGFPRIEEIAMDWTVFGFAALLTLIVAVGLALAPGLAALRIDIHETLKGTARFTGKSSGSKTRRSLVIAEVALSFVLMIAAGLLVRSFLRLQAVDSGIRPRNVLVTRMSLPMAKYSTSLRTAQFVSTLLDAIRRTPGVGDAAVASALPLSGVNSRSEFFVSGYPPTNVADTPAAQTRWISEDYFDVMGIPIDRGKALTAFDRGSDLVGIVDEALVRRYMPDMNPLEQSLAIDLGDEPIRKVRVVGVVGNVKHFGLDDPPTPTIYFPLAQAWPSALNPVNSGMTVVLKTTGHAQGLADNLRQTISATDGGVASSPALSMDAVAAGAVAPRKLNAFLMEGLAGVGLILTTFGLYAVLSYSVTQKRYEIAVRMALGARPRSVIALVVGQGFLLAVAGTVTGILASLVVTRGLSEMLFETPRTDIATYTVMSVLLLLVTASASYFPARRAAQTDPMLTLRQS